MDISTASFVNAPPFEFLVGPTEKRFYVHAKLATQLSDTFKSLIDGSMVEAKVRSAHLKDIEEDTFTRFAQYAYTRDYSVPEPEIAPAGPPSEAEPNGYLDDMAAEDMAAEVPMESSAPEEDLVPEAEPAPEPEFETWPSTDWGWGSSRKKKTKKKKTTIKNAEAVEKIPKEEMWNLFQAKAFIQPVSTWEPRPNENVEEIYTPIFQAHASLYVFADRYNIDGLKDLTLQKLRCNLAHFTLYDSRRVDIVDLASFTYANTIDNHGTIDRLRDLVSDYVVCHLEDMGTCTEFLDLLADVGSLAQDVVSKSLHRLN